MRHLSAIVLLLVFAISVQAQAGGGNFKGQVLYQDNSPATHVLVELWTDGGTYRTTVTTDDSGRFQAQAPFGVIQYKVELTGFRHNQGREDIRMSGRALVQITLRALPGTAIPGAAAVDQRVAQIPPDAKKQFAAGQEAMDSNDLAGAVKHFQKATELYPRYAEAFQLLGVAQLQTAQKAADLQAAEASEMKAIEIEKNLPNA